jgi:hypothetical protein
VRAQCLTILLFKHFALCGTITGWLSTALSQMSTLTVGSNLGRGRESQTSRLPNSSLEAHGLLVTGFPDTGRIFGRQADVAHPSPGSFGSHGHRIDFCESAVHTMLLFVCVCVSLSLSLYILQNPNIIIFIETIYCECD